LKIGGVIDAATASSIENALLAILPVTLAEKASKEAKLLEAA